MLYETALNRTLFHFPKIVSLLYELTDDERIRDAFRLPVQETMLELEAKAKTRVRKKGADSSRTTGNRVCVRFYHSCSRTKDGVSGMKVGV